MTDEAKDGLLREVARLYVQLQRRGVACCDETTLTQCTLLTEVGRRGPLTLAALSQEVGLDKSWTSRAVQRLVEEGLLLKTPGVVDRRSIILALSPAGEARYQMLNQTLNAQSTQVMSRIPAAEREKVVEGLELLLTALRAELDHYKEETA